MGRPKIPGKCPAFESISLVLQICDVFSIGAVTAKELLLLTLSFIGILKQNSLSVFPLTFLFTIVGFFFCQRQVWNSAGGGSGFVMHTNGHSAPASLCRMWLCPPAQEPSGSLCCWVGERAALNLL